MIIDSTLAQALSGATIYPRWLVWFKVKNITTGAVEQAGMWNDLGNLNISFGGATRTYIGVGALLGMPEFSCEKGLNVQTQSLTLSMLSPEVITLLRGYDVQFGEIEIHLALLDANTNQVLGTTRTFQGWIDSLNISESETTAAAELTLVPSIRAGTRTIPTKQSDASQRLRDEADTGRIYADISAAVPISWGAYSDLVPRFRIGGSKGFRILTDHLENQKNGF